jgi:four helix bundle protein
MVTERRGRRRIEGWGRETLAGRGMAVPGCGGQLARMAMHGRRVLFDQDRLDAYNLARAFTREVELLLKQIPRGFAEAFEQIRRATLSITLNTAEGAGEFTPKEKARFYRIARRSATEAAAVLDSFVDRGVLTESAIEPGRAVLHRIVGALTRLIQSCDPDWTRARRASLAHQRQPASASADHSQPPSRPPGPARS